jgi:hypothetical protein
MPTVAIISSAHWSGDPRLNRHVRYLERAGVSVRFATFRGPQRRLRSIGSALFAIFKTDASVLILADPELFIIGTIVARMRGKTVIVDIRSSTRR